MKTNEQIIKEAIENRDQAIYEERIKIWAEREPEILKNFPEIISLGNNTYTLAGYKFFGSGEAYLMSEDWQTEISNMTAFAYWVERKLRQEEEDNKPKPLTLFQKFKQLINQL